MDETYLPSQTLNIASEADSVSWRKTPFGVYMAGHETDGYTYLHSSRAISLLIDSVINWDRPKLSLLRPDIWLPATKRQAV